MLLMEKYRIQENEARLLADFLTPMLAWYPDRRATARQMLTHPWLTMPPNYNYKMSEKEHRSLCLKKKMEEKPEPDGGAELLDSDRDIHGADIEDNSDPEANLDTVQDDSADSTDLDPQAKKYSLHSELLNVDHGPNPQFRSFHNH